MRRKFYLVFELKDKRAVIKVLHMATNSSSLGGLHNLSEVGCIAPRSARILSLATLARTSMTTLSRWPGLSLLREACLEHSTCDKWYKKDYTPIGWDSEAFVVHLS